MHIDRIKQKHVENCRKPDLVCCGSCTLAAIVVHIWKSMFIFQILFLIYSLRPVSYRVVLWKRSNKYGFHERYAHCTGQCVCICVLICTTGFRRSLLFLNGYTYAHKQYALFKWRFTIKWVWNGKLLILFAH